MSYLKFVFGKKNMENIRRRVNIQLVTSEEKKIIAKPNYKRRTIFDEKLVAAHTEKNKFVIDKPIYLFRILHLGFI